MDPEGQGDLGHPEIQTRPLNLLNLEIHLSQGVLEYPETLVVQCFLVHLWTLQAVEQLAPVDLDLP